MAGGLRRAAHDRVVVAAAFLTVLIAATLLASAPIYAEAVALSGLRRTLGDDALAETSVQVSSRLPSSRYERADASVTRAVRALFGDDGASLYRSGRSDSYALPDSAWAGPKTLAVLAFYEDLPAHARLVAGQWPRGEETEPVTAALPGLPPGASA